MKIKDLVSAVVVLIFLGIAAYIVYGWIQDYNALSVETVELTEYYDDVEDDEMMVFENGRLTDELVPYLDGHMYLRLEYVQELNQRYYWDEGVEKLIFTNDTEIMLIGMDEKKYTVENGFVEEGSEQDGYEKEVDYIILRTLDEKMYIAYDFVKDTINARVSMFFNPNRVMIRTKWGEYLYAKVAEDTQLRDAGNIKANVIRELPAGTKLELTDSNGSNREGFLLAVTEDGVKAYVDEDYLGDSYYEVIESKYTEPEFSHITMDEPVNLVWNIVVARDKNSDIKTLMKNVTGVNVLSPTWFNLKDTEGNLEDRASADYVTYAHENGLKVWALVSNFNPGTNELNLDESVLLKDRTKRAALIKNLTDAADKYGFDGINVDFENIAKAAGPHYVQFIRELSVACRYKGLLLSVDNTVPFEFNAYYDIGEQSKFADYIVIMAYDEHYVGSEAGSVASLTYVKTAIANTLAKVDKAQVIMGMPFYTRIWRVVQLTDGNHKTYSETATMPEAAKFVKTHNMTGNWYEAEAQYYYTADEGDTTYKIWMEDLESITAKLKEISAADIAGVAGWRLGQEDSGVWEIITSFIK